MDFNFDTINDQIEASELAEKTYVNPETFEVVTLEDAKKALDTALAMRTKYKAQEDLKKKRMEPINAQRDLVNQCFCNTLKLYASNIDKLVESLDKWANTSDQGIALESLKTDTGTMYKKKRVEPVITDIELIPVQFLQLNIEAVEEAVKAGVKIPGIEIVETQHVYIKLASHKE